MIETRALTKAYGDTLVVDDVTLTLPRGGVTTIIGPNGAGKSTLLSMIGRLLPSTQGSVWVDELNVAEADSAELAKKLAVLRQDNAIEVHLSVRELISFGRYPHSRGQLKAEDHAAIDRALRFLALEPLADRSLATLSGGQRQRAFIAMVLCQETDIVLLDEPLNSLDMKSAAMIMERMRGAADTLGKTVVLVLHDINFASFYSDRIIAMRRVDGALGGEGASLGARGGGRIVADGAPAEVITRARLRAIFDMDIPVQEYEGKPLAIYY